MFHYLQIVLAFELPVIHEDVFGSVLCSYNVW